MDDSTGSIPSAPSSLPSSSMSLSNPNTVLSGTYRGNQNVGSAQLNIDSVNNVISVKGVNTLGSSIVKYGQIGNTGNYLGFAVNDGTNDIMFAGEDSTTSPATTYVKIAKPGFDAKTASAANLIFNSNQDTFKIVATGTLNLPSQSFTTTSNTYGTGGLSWPLSVSAPHNLTFIPTVLGFYNNGGIYTPLQFIYMAAVSSSPSYFAQFTINVATDDVNVYASATAFGYNVAAASGGTVTFSGASIKYYLLQETAN